ncbi:uncharacterized protein LOC128198686 [Bicyclus anynana]|uniref:Uncharacterized protein LOC128198686 n=1 Tax=Bicyclus anynana TaxID=110368 RepID=A0ABM3LPT9_BICAN|nr:uncharacterized protein LOC128198686 [Bicyclus anynana]
MTRFRLECGVRQGELSSPALFNLNIIIDLGNARFGCSIDGQCVNSINYADDMMLLSPSVKVFRLLTIADEYTQKHSLLYNVKKIELLVFWAGSQKLENVPPMTNVTGGGIELR